MKIAATDENLSRILARSFFRIPRFQRPYSWGEVEVGEWLRDTANANGDYFIGSMVCYTDGDILQVVDGQQRLTTVTLFMAALRDQLLEIGEENLAQRCSEFHRATRPRFQRSLHFGHVKFETVPPVGNPSVSP